MKTQQPAISKQVAASRPAAAPAAPPKASASAQRQQYAEKLISADLKLETAKAHALKKEAAAIQGFNPQKAAHLAAAGDDRLGLISAEQSQRELLAQAKLANGQSAASFAQSARRLSPGELSDQLAAATGGKAGPDSSLRALVLTREQGRRAAGARAAAQTQESQRLDQVKQDYQRQLTGETPAELSREQKSEHARLSAAQASVAEANTELAAAPPETHASAEALVAAAEKSLRTEYAKTAVIDSEAPVKVNHQALHDYANTLKAFTPAQLAAEKKQVSADYQQMLTHPGLSSRSQQQTERIKLAIIDAAIARSGQKPSPVDPTRKVDKTRNPGNTVFNGPGMFIANASAYPASANAAKLRAAGVKWVTLQVNNNGPVDGNLSALQSGWADQWRAQGFKVGFWGCSYGGDAADAARLGAKLTAQYHGDFYIADCEGPFQAGEGDPARNKVFVDAFQDEANRDGIGNIPRSLSSMGRVALDMKPWIDNGWDAMPQAYWNDYNVYQPSACVKFYEDSGWPKDRIHPTIATYGATGDQTQPKQLKDYVADLKAGGTTGFSYYLPESYLDDTEYQQLVDGIRGGMNGPA